MHAIWFILTLCWVYTLCVRAAEPPLTLGSLGLFAPNKTLTPPLDSRRIDPPPSLTLVTNYNPPGIPDDTITFTFSRILMSTDDVTIALLSVLKRSIDHLSAASGNPSAPLTTDFSLRDSWYRFELGWDQHSQEKKLLISELYVMVMKLLEVSLKYVMREVTFRYMVQGKFHAVGRLRNPIRPPPRRKMAVGPKYMTLPSGHVEWSDYGRSMDFELVANTMISLLDNSWQLIVASRKHAGNMVIDRHPFTYRDVRGKVEIEVSGPEGRLSLEEVMDVATYMVEFGRVFFMEEHTCVFTNTYYPTETKIVGTLLKAED